MFVSPISSMLLATTILTAAGSEPPSTADAPEDLRCGTYCLFVGLRAMNLGTSTFEEFEKKVGQPGPRGYSMLELETLAKTEGANTQPVQTSLENLNARKESFVCIALLNHSHFVLLYDFDDKSAFIVDPPRIVDVPLDTFRQSWTGKALLLSRQALLPEESINVTTIWTVASRWSRSIFVTCSLVVASIALYVVRKRFARLRLSFCAFWMAAVLASGSIGCAQKRTSPSLKSTTSGAAIASPATLVIDPIWHRVGDVLRESGTSTMAVKTLLSNTGGELLKVEAIRVGCSCTSTSITRELIPAGESAVLTTTILLGDSPLPRNTTVSVLTNDKARPIVPFQIEWRAINHVRADPVEVSWTKIQRGHSESQTIKLHASKFSLCPSCRVTLNSTSDSITGVITETDAPRTSHLAPGGPPIDSQIASIAIKVQASGDLGFRRFGPFVSVDCGNQTRARVEIPTSWTVSTPVIVAPEAISLGLSRGGQTVAKTLLVSSNEKKPFRILDIKCEQAGVLVSQKFQTDPSPLHTLALRFRTPEGTGPWRSTLSITTDLEEASSLSVPVSALIESSIDPGISSDR